MEMKFNVDIDNIKIKDFLELKGCSRNFRRQVRVKDNLFVNGEKVKNYFILKIGDELVIKVDEERNSEIIVNATPLDILFEDEYLLIVNKPSGISSQPSRKHPDDNLISMIHHYYLENNITTNVHLVNRLDFLTTGIVIVAKAGFIHHALSSQVMTKKYLCYITGTLEEKQGTIDLPIRRIAPLDIRRGVTPDGQRAITHYQVLKEYEDKSLVEVQLETGRTHQIRVHFSYLGHPLVGENLYSNGTGGLMLHCYLMKFIHPISKEPIEIIKHPDWEELDA